MTQIDFHTNVGDTLDYACRLLRKIYRAGQPVVVRAEPPQLRALNERLWTFSPLDFIPHCALDDACAAETPIVLAADVERAPHHRILLNLGMDVPVQFARFERLLEVVGSAPDELASGRDRYRFYRERGYPLNNHQVGG